MKSFQRPHTNTYIFTHEIRTSSLVRRQGKNKKKIHRRVCTSYETTRFRKRMYYTTYSNSTVNYVMAENEILLQQWSWDTKSFVRFFELIFQCISFAPLPPYVTSLRYVFCESWNSQPDKGYFDATRKWTVFALFSFDVRMNLMPATSAQLSRKSTATLIKYIIEQWKPENKCNKIKKR